MTTPNWKQELMADNERSLADKIQLYIGNTGNLMFLNGCEYIGQLEGNECEYYDWYKMTKEEEKYKKEINEKYDLVIYPLANILQGNAEYIMDVTRRLQGITIPIYCIGIGLSCRENDSINELVQLIKEPVLQLIKVVDSSGGKFACRGYITQELLERIWGEDSKGKVLTTGCPSMYQNGILNIKKKEVSSDFRLAFNGKNRDFSVNFIRKAMEQYNAIYIDQDEYCQALYGEGQTNVSVLAKKSYFGTKLLSEKRIKLFYQLPAWYQYISQNVDFMFGTRIHGNLISLLAGKSALIYLPPNADLRVCELADYFGVPTVRTLKGNLTDLFEKADYTMFNKKHVENFERFEKFLVDNNICDGLPREKNVGLAENNQDSIHETLNYEMLNRQMGEMSRVSKEIYRLREYFW